MVLRLLQSSAIRHTLNRAYSTTPAPPPNTLPLKQIVLGGLATGAGILAYVSFAGSSSSSDLDKAHETATKPMTTTSALSPKGTPKISPPPKKKRSNTKKTELNIPFVRMERYETQTSGTIQPQYVYICIRVTEGTDSGLHVASCLITKSVARDGPLACNDDKGKPVIRPYTPITPPKQKDTLHLMVKNYVEGKMTNHFFSLKPGDKLSMKGPFPKWLYKPNEFKTIGMIAGGSGITPHWQIIQEIAANPQDKTKVVLLFANQKEEDILLREEFESKISERETVSILDQFRMDEPPKNWPKELRGYLTKETLKSKLPSPSLGAEVKIFVCGPPGQVAAIAGPKDDMEQGELKGILKDIGFSQDQVYKF
ncbi:hypothetical protein PSHT_10064 [Puccinia striiformis]|uniref:cytochrome-b5 reductase n=1 Tax=Puccinia striiformis TaxID=27350 RepID=A0A2S4VCA8_9BASI|nr:hypothetical protein PSHT_10064 [Puccinia striiformis]